MAKKEVANQLKAKFKNHERMLGTFIWMGGASTVEAIGYSALDFTFNKDDVKRYYDMGADAVVYSSDVNVMVSAFQNDIKDIQE